MADGFREQVAYFSSLGSRASEWLFYSLIFIFPFFALPSTIFPVALNKSYLLYFGIIIVAVVYLISALQSGTLRIPKSLAGVFLLVFLAALLVSAIFSQSTHSSFSGLGSEPGTLSAIGAFVLTFVLAFLVLDSEEKSFRALFALFGSFVVLFLFQIFQIFEVPLWSALGSEQTFNLFGSWNELGVFAGLIALLSAIFLESLPRSYLKIALWVLFVLSLIVAAIVNFALVWYTLAGVSIVFLAYYYSQRQDSGSLFKVTFILLLISLVFIFAGDLVTDIVDRMGIQFVEIRPNLDFTFKTAGGALSENAAFGHGPNTFLYAWFQYRPTEILSTPFWQTRFNSGYGFVPTLLVTTGLVGVIALIAFIAFFIYYGFKALVKTSTSSSFLILATFVGALYLWVFAFMYSGGFSLLFPLFLLSGIFFALAMRKGIMDYYEISLFEHSVAGFIGALSLILFIVLGVSWFSLLAQKYYAAVLYGEGVRSMATGKYDDAQDSLSRSVRFDKRDLYLRTFADLGITRLQLLVSQLNAGTITQQDFQQSFQNILAQTIQNAQDASSVNPADGVNWMSLGRIYEAMIGLQIQGASDEAQKAYAKAAETFPTTPEPLLAQARVEIAKNDLPKASEFLNKAVAMKADFAQAHFLIAQIQAASGNIGPAIRSAEITASLAPNDVGVLFQLGLLYYQDQKFAESRAVFERAVQINSSYSNAKYFLGLIYARQNEHDKALAEFRKIEELNPGNAEVRRIIENLEAGKEPLFGIAPPAPEDREQPPVDQ